MPEHEINFDGIVGPTHNYAGLSYGNVASMKHRMAASSPKRAALEGLAKMRFLMELGVKQAVFPPHERPHLPTLRSLGYTGSDGQVLEKVATEDPVLLAAVCSSSNMWTANAATVSPSADCADGKVHLTPANLVTQFHRSIEPPQTTRTLRAIFKDESRFAVHDPLPSGYHFADEGAANHTRLHAQRGGVEIFVFGRKGFDPSDPGPKKFPARQTLEACTAIARSHGVDSSRTCFIRQDPDAIDAGAFHNDVLSVGHRDVLLVHGMAFMNQPRSLRVVSEAFELAAGSQLKVIEVPNEELSIDDAVSSYLFNSQLVTVPSGAIELIAPIECRENPRVKAVIDRIVAQNLGISRAHFVDVRQSMHNGGGPACLRLRVSLTDDEVNAIHQGVLLNAALLLELEDWVKHHYRDTLEAKDLSDPKLLDESRAALDKLTSILNLGSIYACQR